MEGNPKVLILAGGLGTRLKSVVQVPKCLAPIKGIPFIYYQLEYLISQNINEAYLSVGHQSELVVKELGSRYKTIVLHYIHEKEPLGTGGAIQLAAKQITSEHLLVLNGDTFYPVQLNRLMHEHLKKNADTTFALKPLENFDRYGAVQTDNRGRINEFHEKTFVAKGDINGGIYAIKTASLLSQGFAEKFSIEQDYFQAKCAELNLQGVRFPSYFIDIGIPTDFDLAQETLPKLLAGKLYQESQVLGWNIDTTWTLFLDRDGVINVRLVDDYVKNSGEFEFISGSPEAIAQLSKKFGRTVVVTNQQGIGKGLMTETDLAQIHDKMKDGVTEVGGKIDAAYHAPNLASENSSLRKPDTGMAVLARRDFPLINYQKSVMVGDSDSDIAFGIACGMQTVFIGTKKHPLANITVKSLEELSILLS